MTDLPALILLAYQAVEEAVEAPAPEPGLGSLFNSLAFPVLLTVLVILLFNPFGKREDKKQKEFIESLKKNDRVILAGGIYARIVNVKPIEDEVVVKVDEDRDFKMTVTKAAILKKVEKGEKADESAKSSTEK